MMMMGALSDQGPDAAAGGMRGYRYKHGDRPLEGYTIQRAAGRGAFGEVYFAISDSGREVALKVVQAYEQVELRGIGQCMNLKSPHLVSVFDVRDGEHGQPIVIMEYVAGPSLRDLLDESPSGFGAQKAAFFLREIGKGLTYLHDSGIVHRDLKPANIFYENGYVKIGDYGLSKAISASHRSAQTVTVGTLHYMAPEVGNGCYDRSVDIYALGALLYEMLTGQPPFFGVSPAEVLMKHISAAVCLDGIEEPFATVVARALEKDPARRYQSVQEMVEGVFGAEHIRQSVSCFAPTSLTMVAGQVARRAAGLRDGLRSPAVVPLSSRAYDVTADGPVLSDEVGLVGGLRRRARMLRRRARHASLGLARRARAAAVAARGAVVGTRPIFVARAPVPAYRPPPVALQTVDPLQPRHRALLAGIAMLAVAVTAGVFADNRDAAVSAWFVLLGTLGATVGICCVSGRFLPDLNSESRFVRHLAAGGLAAAMTLITTLPAWVSTVHRTGWGRAQGAHTLAGICLSLLVVDWTKRAASNRASRVSFGHLVVVGIVAVVAAALLEAAPEVVIGVLCGTCIAVQIASPWTPGAASVPRNAPQPAPDGHVPSPENQPTPPSGGDPSLGRDLAVGSPSAVIPSVYTLARRSVAAGRHVVMWPIRLLLNLVAFALALATFLLAAALALDLPGLLESGRIDPRIPDHMRRGMGVENWPFVLRSIGGAGLFLLGCLALLFTMWARRSRGAMHLLRGVAGAALLFAAPFVLARPGIDWAAPVETVKNGWAVWQELVQGLSPLAAVRAVVMFVGGMVLLLWPAGPVAAGAVASEQSSAPNSPPLLADASK